MTKCSIMSVCGTRPEVIRVIRRLPNHFVVDTGQHDSFEMNEQFWQERGWKPDLNLKAKSLGDIYKSVSELIHLKKPKIVIVYGDTRTSFAVGVAAKDSSVKLAHLEAGVRGYDMKVPEERYRIMIDSISDYLFPVNKKGYENLMKENVHGEIFIVGDILLDQFYSKREHDGYIVMTIHRKENQDRDKLKKLLLGYHNHEIYFPVHPSIRRFLPTELLKKNKKWHIINPIGHIEMIYMISRASLVVTDSGGLMREAHWQGVPVRVIMEKNPWEDELNNFGDGHAEEKIRKILLSLIKRT